MNRLASESNILVGGLLMFWGIVFETYMFTLHQAPDGCTTTSVLLGGTCYSTWGFFLAPIVIGLIMFIVGTVRRPIEAEAEDLLRTDPFTRTLVSCFLTLTVASLFYLGVVLIDLYVFKEAPIPIIIRGAHFTQIDVLGFLAATSGVFTIALSALNWTHVRRRQRFLAGYTRAVARHRGGLL